MWSLTIPTDQKEGRGQLYTVPPPFTMYGYRVLTSRQTTTALNKEAFSRQLGKERTVNVCLRRSDLLFRVPEAFEEILHKATLS